MKAYITSKENLGKVKLIEKSITYPQKRQVLIKILAVSLNRRDVRMIDGTYSFKFEWGQVLGADCCGQVISCGGSVKKFKDGDFVVVNPNVNWGNTSEIPSSEYSILGSPKDGVFQEYIAVDESRVFYKPNHLSIEQASCIPLTGLTAYRALFVKAKSVQNDALFIPGISGNVSQMLLKFAKAIDMSIYVSSSKEESINRSISNGAILGFNYKTDSLKKFCKRNNLRFDIVIDSIGGTNINDYIDEMKQGGRIIVYGAMKGKAPNFDLFSLYYNQISILGTLMGNDSEFESMLNFVSNYTIIPTIDKVFAFNDIDIAFSRLRNNENYGKIVLKF
ncbi:zinc-binding dehydrogenase [Kordia jejudonensis]|uniref:zinc-binding dehydrogenase n=1 Tax=Kordia jejudonensis TaxID=1348245 RepID=UPI00062974BC|nr:zinc-binding dehydrogenase [Kordia jejudonensis]